MSDPALVLMVGLPQSTRLPWASLLESLGFVGVLRHGVADVESRLLADLHLRGPASGRCQGLPSGWREHPSTQAARLSLQAPLQAAIAAPTQAAVVGHLCDGRLVPFWRELAQDLGLALQVQIWVVDPATLASPQVQQLWWRHSLDAVHAARSAGLPLVCLNATSVADRPDAWLDRWLRSLPGGCASAVDRKPLLALMGQALAADADAPVLPAVHPQLKRLHRRLLLEPLPRRLPAADLPSRLSAALAVPMDRPSASQPQDWPPWLERFRGDLAPRAYAVPPLAPDPVLHVCGVSWHELDPHLWLQRVPCPDLGRRPIDPQRCQPHRMHLCPDPTASGSLERLALNLELPPPERAAHWLAHLRAQQLILDPDPARVLLLRSMDLPAWWLDSRGAVNSWLEQPAARSAVAWAQWLGMVPPAPGALILLGSAGAPMDRALAAEAAAATRFEPDIHYCPGWPELIVTDAETGLARAGWLQAAARQAARLVACSTSTLPEAWSGLDGLSSAPLCLPPDSTPTDLRALHCGIPLRVLAEDRPSPPQDTLFQWSGDRAPAAAVVVSLFNYADRISDALDSVAAQSCDRLELIVVDDASSDAGAERVVAWMNACLAQAEHPFVRLLLLCHTGNAGLATARNTAFAAAQSPWCFVLDADNALYPRAVEACLHLAQTGDEQLAVVHPLLAVEVEAGRPDDQRSLVSTASWQRSRLLGGNVVDAMALVRRSAWEAVGGYTHIQGGWEDFDFWCKLLHARFYGLQCPEVLAVYRSHADSMSHTATNRSWRALSRTLQDRHPWLDLPLATP